MPPNKFLKYILDIEGIISEIDEIKKLTENNFHLFKNNIVLVRAVERQLEIIGEALNKLNQINPSINISGIKSIISLRNLIAHAYDTVEIEIIWAIIQKDIPILKQEIFKLKG